MAYAAYHAHEMRAFRRSALVPAAARLQVLHITVSSTDARKVRQAVAGCDGAAVVRCQATLRERVVASETPRVRLMVALPPSRHAAVLHALIQAVPAAELGHLVSWREHLNRCGLECNAS